MGTVLNPVYFLVGCFDLKFTGHAVIPDCAAEASAHIKAGKKYFVLNEFLQDGFDIALTYLEGTRVDLRSACYFGPEGTHVAASVAETNQECMEHGDGIKECTFISSCRHWNVSTTGQFFDPVGQEQCDA
jgi:hypothetical protein